MRLETYCKNCQEKIEFNEFFSDRGELSLVKGNNIELTFDGTRWSYTNTAQDFIDTSAFSTEEPEFPTATEPTTPDEEIPNCPAGYIYDNTLPFWCML